MKLSKTILTAALLANASMVYAAADFMTIRSRQFKMNDAAPKLVVSFTLPDSVNRSTSTVNSAVLDLEAGHSEFNFNEVYINPPTTVCTSNDTDANQAGSIGFLQEHDDAGLRFEVAANHKAFSSALLKAGTNQIMICVRSVSGEAGPGVGNLDNVTVRSVVLHYHTTQ